MGVTVVSLGRAVPCSKSRGYASGPAADRTPSAFLRARLDGDAIRADGRRLEQVLANLIDNAIRFAPEGSDVLLTSRRVAGGVLIEVHNGGDPIPPEQGERVSDRFYQVDAARSAPTPRAGANRREAGSHRGLGLSIVQELVQAHGGTVAIESTAAAPRGEATRQDVPRPPSPAVPSVTALPSGIAPGLSASLPASLPASEERA